MWPMSCAPRSQRFVVTETLALIQIPNRRFNERLQRELNRLQQLVADLLELNRLNPPPRNRVESMAQVEIRELPARPGRAWPLAEQRRVELIIHSSGSHPVRGNASRLHRALLNLLDNALRYSPDDTSIEVQLLQEGRWEALKCAIAVKDSVRKICSTCLIALSRRPLALTGQAVGSGWGWRSWSRSPTPMAATSRPAITPRVERWCSFRCLQTRHEQRAPTAAKGALPSWCVLEAARRRADAPRPRAAQWSPGQTRRSRRSTARSHPC